MHQKFYEPVGCQAESGNGWLRRAIRSLQRAVERADATLALWHFRAKSRREIERLDDRLLRDAGVDRSEARKPFWRK